MHCPFDRLDASSRDYLRRIWQTRGQDDHGIFVLQQRLFLRGVVKWFLLALAALGIVFLITQPAPYSLLRLGAQVGLAGLAGLFLVLGLLRGYRSEWTITLRPPGQGNPWLCDLASSPAEQLHYQMEKDDPDWAPYAIILYSSFDDMASRLVAGFGLPQSPQRQTYTFAEAVGNR